MWSCGLTSAAILAVWQTHFLMENKEQWRHWWINTTSCPCLCSSLSSLAQRQPTIRLWEREVTDMHSQWLASTVTNQKWVAASLHTADPTELQSQGSGICWFVDVHARCSRCHLRGVPICYGCWTDSCSNYSISSVFWPVNSITTRVRGLVLLYFSQTKQLEPETDLNQTEF